MDWNKLKDGAKESALNFADKSKDIANEVNENRKKSKQETKFKFKNKIMGQIKITVVRKDLNGLYYISNSYSEDSQRFTFENLEFGGSTVIQKTSGTTKQKGRAGSALVGGIIAGPVGAIAGGSRKRKGKINTTTTSEEKEGNGILHLRNVHTNEVKSIKFMATTSELSNMERFFN